jgi:hypothetical protein
LINAPSLLKLGSQTSSSYWTRHLQFRNDANKQGRELSDIVEALNGCITSQINAEQFNSILDRIRKSLRASQDTRTWPTIKAFTKAAGEAATRKDITATNRVIAFDRHEIAARRIHAGESVGQSYIWGRDAAISRS